MSFIETLMVLATLAAWIGVMYWLAYSFLKGE